MTPTNNASTWRAATVIAVTDETPTSKTFTFDFGAPVTHLAGQHYEIRLTAPDGYQAARLYSAASPAGERLELTVALLPDGEVSPYLHAHVKTGDQLELRGPLGKFFVWQPRDSQPVLLIAGGSGVVPMRCMLQAHTASGSAAPMTLLYSARDFNEIMYKNELLDNPAVHITLSDDAPSDWTGATGRIGAPLLRSALASLDGQPGTVYLCGRNAFVEAMAQLLLTEGIPPARIRAERFGG